MGSCSQGPASPEKSWGLGLLSFSESPRHNKVTTCVSATAPGVTPGSTAPFRRRSERPGTPSPHPCWPCARGLRGPGKGDGLSPRLREARTKDSILANSPSPSSGARSFCARLQGRHSPCLGEEGAPRPPRPRSPFRCEGPSLMPWALDALSPAPAFSPSLAPPK